jgi:arylesterase/paraoxonase
LPLITTEAIFDPKSNLSQNKKGAVMVKKILLAVVVLVLVAGGWFVHMLWSVGQFDTIEPHYAGECTPITGVGGPEDITIHPETGVAYISASDRRAVIQGKPANGAIYTYDLNSITPKLIRLTAGAGGDFHPHGISLYVGENGQDSLFVRSYRRRTAYLQPRYRLRETDTAGKIRIGNRG